MKTVIACIADTHIGSSTGLCPPKFTTHTGRKGETQTNNYNDYQKWLYACWQDFWTFVIEKAGIRRSRRDSRLFIFHLGDVVDGNHHASTQIIQDPADQMEAAVALLGPLAKLADRMFITYGTDVHNGGAGAYEIAIAGELGNNVRHADYFSLDVDGVRFDLAHHGRAGMRDWTSTAAGYAVDVALQYFSLGAKPPHYVLRAHNHRVDDSGARVEYARYISLPCWQLRTSFGHRVSAGMRRPNIGGVIIDTAAPEQPDFKRARYAMPKGGREYEVC